jgi:hypothetical protein
LGGLGDRDVEGLFDDVGGSVEAVDLLHLGLDAAGCGAVSGVVEGLADGFAQAGGVELAAWDDDAGSAGGDASSYAGLVVALRERDQGNAFGEGFEDGVEAHVGDDGGGALDELQLRRVGDDDRVAGERT